MPAETRPPSSARLAAALEAIPGVPSSMVVLARAGYYHDYRSPLATPDLQLVADLRALARDPGTPKPSRPLLSDLVGRVVGGEFDADRAESDEWARSPEGEATLRGFLGPAAPGR